MNSPSLPRVRSGAVIAQRLFGVSDSIDLAKVEALWAQLAAGRVVRSQLKKTPAKAVAFDVPPLLITLEPVTLSLHGADYPAELTARIYDFGVITLALRVAVEDMAWADYSRVANALGRAAGPDPEHPVWASTLQTLSRLLSTALTRPTQLQLQEDYLLAVVRQWSEPLAASAVLEDLDLVPLMSGEQRPLAAEARRELLRHAFSYYEDDLVVLTWDRAFVYEPSGDTEVCDILEVANAQLLELRYYDELLDDELPRMYDLVEQARRRSGWRSPRRFAHLARRLYTLVAEVTELTEKVDNALQVTEDVYLARIYQAALKAFRVPAVSAAVDRKLSIIRDTYTALFDEATTARGELLELAVIILILAEIVVAIKWHM